MISSAIRRSIGDVTMHDSSRKVPCPLYSLVLVGVAGLLNDPYLAACLLFYFWRKP